MERRKILSQFQGRNLRRENPESGEACRPCLTTVAICRPDEATILAGPGFMHSEPRNRYETLLAPREAALLRYISASARSINSSIVSLGLCSAKPIEASTCSFLGAEPAPSA